MITERFHIAVPTAFNDDESLNLELTLGHIKSLHKQSVKSVMLCGSTGEQHSLSLDEKIQLVNAIEQSGLTREMEVIFGVSSIKQKEAIHLAEKIRATKISGILLGFSPYILPSQHEALIYANHIIAAAQKKVIVYNNPKRTGFDLAIDNIIKLAENEWVIGLKEAGDPDKIQKIMPHIQKPNFYFYAGGEVELAQKIALGFNALSSMAGNVEPVLIKNYFERLLNQTSIPQPEQEAVTLLVNTIFAQSSIAKIKQMLTKEVIGVCRKPLGN